MAIVQKRQNGQWVNADVNKFSNGAWHNVGVHKFGGGKWSGNLMTQKYTKSWDCSWTQTYRESGTKRTDYRSEKLCQGKYVDEPWGIMRSMIGFSGIADDLKGSTINYVRLFIHNEHWYYYSGGTIAIGYHDTSDRPSNFQESKHAALYSDFSSRGQSKWIDIPNAFAEGIRDGKYKGLTVFKDSSKLQHYGIFSGQNDGGNKPKIEITYTK